MSDSRNIIDVVHSVDSVEDNLSVESYDYIVLDLSSRQYDEFDCVDKCCTLSKKIPVLLVLSRDNVKIISALLDRGADDFILRPFEEPDFHARVKSLLKRNKIINDKPQEFGALKLDMVSGNVSLNDISLDLTKREHGVLEILMRFKGQMVSKDQIAAKLFSLDDNADISSIRIYVSRLRRKIQGSGMYIRSIRGVGYSLDQEN